jgi:hypothetical protein
MRVDYFERGLAAARELYTALGDLRS